MRTGLVGIAAQRLGGQPQEHDIGRRPGAHSHSLTVVETVVCSQGTNPTGKVAANAAAWEP